MFSNKALILALFSSMFFLLLLLIYAGLLDTIEAALLNYVSALTPVASLSSPVIPLAMS